MEFLKSGYTEVWVPSNLAPLIRFADRVRSIASAGLDLLGLPDVEPHPHLISTLQGFDSVVSWYGTNRPELRAALPQACFLSVLPGPENRNHCADFFAKQVGAPVPAIPGITCSTAEPKDFAIIHPFSGSPRKNWPLDRYRELAQNLPWAVQWCAGPDEELPRAVRFDNLYELACWIATARLYIGNDSGITHLAAAAGTPVIAIFGPTDPAIWGPRGTNVRIVRGDLNTLPVSSVLDKIG